MHGRGPGLYLVGAPPLTPWEWSISPLHGLHLQGPAHRPLPLQSLLRPSLIVLFAVLTQHPVPL